ncbi:hypothetical protein HJ590_13165 [Naumannella sp. ID2617S]|nr:hypothetical protein [Naumannella sp. ID2617S]
MTWPQLEAVIPPRLTEALGVDSGPVTPGDLSIFLRVSVASGTDDGFNDSTLVDVEAFAPTRSGAINLAEDARGVMLALGGTDRSTSGDQLIDKVETATRPAWVDYRNPNVHRVVASYRVTTRSQ